MKEPSDQKETVSLGPKSLLGGLDRSMGALERARKMQERCAQVGFDWNEPAGALDKLAEELEELSVAIERRDLDAVSSEMGDVILAATNVSRLLGVDAEEALHRALDRFQKRFREIERTLESRGQRPEQMDLETLEALWQQAKLQE
jgi:uncharacterized protein YabN with tetrapyrrole methylase and pyrophosphatase domain